MSTASNVRIVQPKGDVPTMVDPLIGHSVLDVSESGKSFNHNFQSLRQEQFNEALTDYESCDGNTYAVTETVWDNKEVTYAFTGLILKGDQTNRPWPRQLQVEDFVDTFLSGKSPYTSVLTKGTGQNRVEQRLLLFCRSKDRDAEGRPQMTSGQTDWAYVDLSREGM